VTRPSRRSQPRRNDTCASHARSPCHPIGPLPDQVVFVALKAPITKHCRRLRQMPASRLWNLVRFRTPYGTLLCFPREERIPLGQNRTTFTACVCFTSVLKYDTFRSSPAHSSRQSWRRVRQTDFRRRVTVVKRRRKNILEHCCH
jgi:hypothetical protein